VAREWFNRVPAAALLAATHERNEANLQNHSSPGPTAPREDRARVARAIATAGGAGYSPQSPGTVGSLVGLPIAVALHAQPLWLFAAVTAALFAVGTWSANRADQYWGTHDSGRIVIDEVVGLLVTVACFDCSDWVVLGLGFGLFRLFDIVKPWPIRAVDRKVGGGLGVMLDDVVAGVFAALALWAIVAAGGVPLLHELLW